MSKRRKCIITMFMHIDNLNLHGRMHNILEQRTLPTFSQTQSNNSYRQVSNISCTLIGNKNVDHSDVVGASPVGAAPTTSSFST